jgi:ABC-type multidrug transport system fused ATPase/permease subunit
MLGVAFAAQGVSQVGNVTEAFAQARVAVYEAMVAMKRKPGSPEKVIYKTQDDVDELGSTTHSQSSKLSRDVETGAEREIKAILPPFRIDSSSNAGLKPKVLGQISFRNVSFHYPTRPGDTVLHGISFDVAAGETVALVGTFSSPRQNTLLPSSRQPNPDSRPHVRAKRIRQELNCAFA